MFSLSNEGDDEMISREYRKKNKTEEPTRG